MKLYGTEGVLLMEVEAISANGPNLHVQGKMMGQVPIKVVIKPSDLRQAVAMVFPRLILKLFLMLFRKDQ